MLPFRLAQTLISHVRMHLYPLKRVCDLRAFLSQLYPEAQGGAAIGLPPPVWDRQGLLQRGHADHLQEGGELQVRGGTRYMHVH